jgi:predicted RNase H-like HicB family nuclease
MSRTMDFHATVHSEGGSYWAEVAELPGCFASGDTEAELQEALVEAIRMCAGDEHPVDELRLTALTLAAS